MKHLWAREMVLLLFVCVFLFPIIVYGESAISGLRLFREKGCIGCHMIRGEGGKVGPALDMVRGRYTSEWIYKWLRDPATVKPGTKMPNPNLTDNERALLVFFLSAQRSGQKPPPLSEGQVSMGRTNVPELDPNSPENEYLKLGVKDSFIKEQRYTLQDQIQSFIPPLYEPAFTQSAFVLPPGALRVAVSFRDVSKIDEDDISNQQAIGARFVDFDLERTFLDFDFFLGLDHNYTLRVNVPFQTSRVAQQINPGFFDPVTVFPKGSSSEYGDISAFLKKKFVDQGNFPIGLAGVAALRLPTGSNSERFNRRTTVNIGGVDSLLPLPAADAAGMPIPGSADGTFRRFSNDGRLPAPLQPGLGTLGGSLGLFATRIFEGGTPFGRGSLHTGTLYEIRPEDDGFDPGNRLTYFASLVKPIVVDKVSLDLTYLLRDQEDDSYDGKMFVPTAMGTMVADRPSFSGGTTQFVGASLVLIPNPLFRVTLSGLYRISEPHLGPSPPFVARLNFQYTFASGLFQ